MDKRHVVDIITFFNKGEERTVENLAKVYKNKEKLGEMVHILVKHHFSTDDIEGKNVLLKPNWVREEQKESDYICLRTNDNLMLCLLEEILKLNPKSVTMADAPVQGCRWDKMITQDFLNKINLLSKEYGVEVIIRDFRRTISDSTNNSVEKNLHPMSEYIIFDVSERSFLEPITTEENRFRVTCYNPDRMAEVHHKGVHKYCIAKKFFEADVVITIPKLKTHRMAGMTNALKLLVGINGDKDYLPHHRIGSVREGGDNYKNWNLLRTLSNRFLDEGNRHRGTSKGKLLSKVGSILFRLSKPDKATLTNAGWYGNDTIWRTVMDINTIAIYGDKEGHLHDTPQRQLYTIMDGIIGGQGDGPLHPAPAPLGVLAFSDNPYLLDVAAGYLYHLEHERIPLLKAAKKLIEGEYCHVAVNNAPVSIEDLYEYGIDIQLSPGWQEYKK